ncbi:sulfite exporter TauE/SafE family protein [Actinoplanes sichuanensis]|uniref:Probable membrane transporter protein n=1 Tax=Actinoplanes sichuanensis TaxID=512349 RepID=A0ABW4A7Y3_9ACTN|nr:sulfite exporter TauE/SafE family protein [Actinoplanes sichuanensis]
MDVTEILLLVVAGIAAGAMNAIAGGGSLITFPSLIAIGLPSVDANVTNSVSVFPGYVSSVAGSRADLAGQRQRVRATVPAAVAGSAVGCALLLLTPARAFEVIVPFLVLGAAATLAFQERLRALVGHPRSMSPRRAAVTLRCVVFAGAIYGGYFGAALGVMYVAALALIIDEPLKRINALKNVLSATVGLVTLLVFAAFARVDWAAAATLAPATIIGGYVGARLARRLSQRVLKYVIVTFGTTIGLLLFYRAALP